VDDDDARRLPAQAAVGRPRFTSSVVQPIDSYGRNTVPPRSANANPRPLPKSTIYGFNAFDRDRRG
jgi:hypothetical protein